ncbi:hypothetical protein NDU88_006365 [Pleurodeles waltl]|uniref:Uncharacterized protein n=1 Tax=Pleurodeles waltl TaxID=8319 RepID=A0AAV7TY70_PLEWA|nr:hypothetical protein NDU88_006365 [Pleurodeles waltl]
MASHSESALDPSIIRLKKSRSIIMVARHRLSPQTPCPPRTLPRGLAARGCAQGACRSATGPGASMAAAAGSVHQG